VIDAVFAPELGESPEALALSPDAFRAAIAGSPRFARLDASARRLVLAIPDVKVDSAVIRQCLELPERLGAALDVRLLVAIDEFQELGVLESKRASIEPYRMMRSAWQRQKHVAYVISGSGRSMLERLVTSKTSPFFQHFELMQIGPLPREAALRLLVESCSGERRIPTGLAEIAIDLVGTRPFYLQMIGDAIIRNEPPYDQHTLKDVVQDMLFSAMGRLSLYFENELERLVGRSANLAAVLEALADGPRRLGEIARAIGAPPGQARGYVTRLADAVQRRPDGRYELDDATFGLWLRWRRPGGSVVPMVVLGDQAERAVAEHLSRCGFELVYQSKASRGAFDLLAMRAGHVLGVQVKRTELPVRFPRISWDRMEADGERYGWRWIVAAVSPDGEVTLFDPMRATTGRWVTLDREVAIGNILSWVDGRKTAELGKPPAVEVERSPPRRGRSPRRP
jgi:Holliday junction resolvase